MKQSNDFKLNQSLFHSSFKEKHLTVHRVRNSILRNVITQSSDQQVIEKHNQNYEKYLRLNPLYKNQLTMYLRCVCNNPEKTLPNKNVIKRVMIEVFDDELMSSIKQDSFFTSVQLLQWRKGTQKQLDKHAKSFYLVLKGRVIFSNKFGETKVKQKQYYGHQQILWGQRITDIKVIKDSVVFSIGQQIFNKCLKQSFDNKFKTNIKKLLKHPCFSNSKHIFDIKRLILKLKQKDFRENEVISYQGDSIQEVYFLTKGKLRTQNQHIHRIKGVGLKQISKCSTIFEHTVFAETTCSSFSIPISIFRNIQYIKWLRNTLPDEPKHIFINIDQIGKDNKSSFKVRKTSMSLKKTIKNERKQKAVTQCVSYQNNFLFLNQKPLARKRGSISFFQ